MATTKTAPQTISLKQFCSDKGFTQITHQNIRANASGYPYITFVTKDNVADNVYLTKNTAAKVAEGDPINKDLLKGLSAVFVEYTDGREPQWKLTTGAESQRIDLEFE